MEVNSKIDLSGGTRSMLIATGGKKVVTFREDGVVFIEPEFRDLDKLEAVMREAFQSGVK